MARGQKPSRRWILGILLLAVALLTALSLPGLGFTRDMGPFGRVWVTMWARAFGRPAVWCLTGLAVLWSSALLVPWRRPFLWAMTFLLAPLLIVWDAFLQSVSPAAERALWHGALGRHLHGGVSGFFGSSPTQTAVALGALALTAAACFFRWALPRPLADWAGAVLESCGRALAACARFTARHAGRLALRAARGFGLFLHGRREARERARGGRRAERPVEQEEGGDFAAGADGAQVESSPPARRSAAVAASAQLPLAPQLRAPAETGGPAAEAGSARHAVRGGKERTREARSSRAGEEIPEAREGPAVALLELLEERADEGSGTDEEEIQRTAGLITQTLASFGISGEVGEVHPGPVITRYEFGPGPGVTVSQISSRQDDLALALRTPRVRLLAPIPGKAAVGIEIPNRVPAIISFREIASRREFTGAREPLCVALGKDVSGRPFYASLEKMPHLLVAGTTGSGKSVCINSMIVSLLLRCPPEQLRLLLIDPKMLELTTYNDIPHLLRPVVTDAREAARGLQWLTREMERRYRVMAGLGVRNIEAYIKRRGEGRDDPPLGAMPYIVVCVDELADLMLSSPAEIEVPIARLAQMARAVGIHLVLATQRPSVDVITGVIKANFPARIAFQVATRTDSRTILDMNGAEALVGRGDMLFIPPGKAQAHRIHGAFLSDAETERVAAYLRQFPPAEELCPVTGGAAEESEAEGFEDPLYHEAMRIVVTTRQGSTSLLQRRLRVGYTRAGRLMDLLERAGVVGPPDGSKARDVLVSPEYQEDAAKQRAVRTG